MDQANLGIPIFKKPTETNNNKDNDSNESNEEDIAAALSFAMVAKAKVLAGRARRRSLFDCETRVEADIGQSTVSHADFPASPPTSLTASTDAENGTNELGLDRMMVYEIIEQEMGKKLAGKYYDPSQCDIYSKQIVTAVKDRIAALSIKNFKIVCICYITKRVTPAMKLESGCAWDELIATVDKDSFADCVFQNEFISAVASVYGVCCQRVPQKLARRSSSFPKTSRAELR